MEDDTGPTAHADSLLPYDRWVEDALRHVVADALRHAAREGLPGEHHFYISFRTDRLGVDIPKRLLAQYPHEITIVLQHQFWDLKVEADHFSVGLSFGGVGSILRVPYAALTAFADPSVQFGLRFHVADDALEASLPFAPVPFAPAAAAPPEPAPAPDPSPAAEPAPAEPDATPQVVSLDAFRRRPPGKD
jgi:hypothetical protein